LYTILIASGLGLLLALIWGLVGLWGGWWLGVVLGLLIFVAVFVIISRVIGKRLEPKLLQSQRQVQSGAGQAALQTLEALLPMGKWQPMLTGQIESQIGSIYFSMGKDEPALSHLSKASGRVAEAQLMMASILSRRKQPEAALKALGTAIKFNRKHMLLYNTAAYIALQGNDRDAAITHLQKGIQAERDHKATQENLNRIQNGKKLQMKSFGMNWYGLKFERPPNSLLQPAAQSMRPGFRQQKRRPR